MNNAYMTVPLGQSSIVYNYDSGILTFDGDLDEIAVGLFNRYYEKIVNGKYKIGAEIIIGPLYIGHRNGSDKCEIFTNKHTDQVTLFGGFKIGMKEPMFVSTINDKFQKQIKRFMSMKAFA